MSQMERSEPQNLANIRGIVLSQRIKLLFKEAL